VLAFASIESPVGTLLAGVREEALCLLEFPKAAHAALVKSTHPLLDRLSEQLREYFAGERRAFDLPLSYSGTDFQQRVWSALLEIPYGQTWSYLDLAKRVGSAEAVRAVGQANGMNPIAIVIPCHRVINASGSLGGYGGGLPRKQHLLNLERGDVLF
jgi:methylated-DNA-[protein]-cysteine S-methyltransferase